MRRILLALPVFSLLAACGPSEPEAPTIPPTELYAVTTPPPQLPLQIGCRMGSDLTATLNLTIGPGKNPTNIAVVQSSGNPQLDALAQGAVKHWEFKPATRNGQPVATKINVPMTFHAPAEKPQECFKYESQH